MAQHPHVQYWLLPLRGEFESYLLLAEEAVSIYRDLGDLHGIPDALEEFGAAQMFTGRFDAARATLEEATELNVALGNRQKTGECTFALGMLAVLEDRPDQARELLEGALATFDDLHDPFWTAFSERMVGHVDRMEENDEAAEAGSARASPPPVNPMSRTRSQAASTPSPTSPGARTARTSHPPCGGLRCSPRTIRRGSVVRQEACGGRPRSRQLLPGRGHGESLSGRAGDGA